jgi:hypothetical protein
MKQNVNNQVNNHNFGVRGQTFFNTTNNKDKNDEISKTLTIEQKMAAKQRLPPKNTISLSTMTTTKTAHQNVEQAHPSAIKRIVAGWLDKGVEYGNRGEISHLSPIARRSEVRTIVPTKDEDEEDVLFLSGDGKNYDVREERNTADTGKRRKLSSLLASQERVMKETQEFEKILEERRRAFMMRKQ